MRRLSFTSLVIIPLLVPALASAQGASAAAPASGATYMNAHVVAASPDGRALTVVGADGHRRTLAVDSRAGVRVGGLRTGEEVLVTARGREDALVITGLKVAGGGEQAAGMTAAAALSSGDYIAARRQRPNPYSLINPMFPADSPKNPWRIRTTGP